MAQPTLYSNVLSTEVKGYERQPLKPGRALISTKSLQALASSLRGSGQRSESRSHRTEPLARQVLVGGPGPRHTCPAAGGRVCSSCQKVLSVCYSTFIDTVLSRTHQRRDLSDCVTKARGQEGATTPGEGEPCGRARCTGWFLPSFSRPSAGQVVAAAMSLRTF